MPIDLTTKNALKELPARPGVPYWMKLEKGRHLGYRKISDTNATWLARCRLEDSMAVPGSGSYEYKALGSSTKTFDFTAARHAADAWFKGKAAVLADEIPTVETVCKEYVEDRRTEKGDKTAYDAEIRFKRTVYEKPIGAVQLDKLTTKRLKDWRAA